MFKEIWQALRKTDVLSEMIGQVDEMLVNGKCMFERASEALMHKIDWTALADELYPRDKQINRIEQKVREQIVTHLSVGNSGDLGPCLMLMSVVKDAERIGDYSKNIFEIGRFYHHEYTRVEYTQPLEEIRQNILKLFDQTRQAFTEADRDKAYAMLRSAAGLTKQCDLLIQQLLSIHDQLAPDEAVAYVLLSRFYKRVAAHLANIATSVVSPVPMLDYYGQMPD